MSWRNAGAALLLAIAAVPVSAFAQNQIAVVGGTVEVAGGITPGVAAVHQALSEKETLRTGPSSLASLAFIGDSTVTLGEQTEIQIQRLAPTPVVWLEHGSLRITSTGSAIQVSTKFGSFSPAELPFAIDFANAGSVVTVTPQRGSVRTQDLDANSVVFRAASSTDPNSMVRSYSSASHVTIQSTPLPATVFAGPCSSPAANSKPPAKGSGPR
jgi:hypothetical protein